jgi:tryptophanyl-tRNA synthetase
MKEIRERRRYYEQNPELVKKIIKEGSEKARADAQKILAEVRKLVKMY